MPKRRSSKVTGEVRVTFKAPRLLTAEELAKLARHLEESSAEWVTAEIDEDGCWCTGFDHRFECRHNPLNKRSTP